MSASQRSANLCSSPVKFPANGLGKELEIEPSVWASATYVGDKDECSALARPNCGCCSHIEREQSDAKSLSPYFPLQLTFK